MRQKFYNALSDLLKNKREEEYMLRLQEVKLAKEKIGKKSAKDYRYILFVFIVKKKSSNPKRGLVSKPMLHNAFNSRAQVDLIDMQSQIYNEFKFIMIYQDHLTKFILLRHLKSKRAEEIVFNLIDIHTTFGAPAILHSDNGREFVNTMITELDMIWGDIKIVHGKPKHSQSQWSVERANRDVEDILATWMAENNSRDWPSGIKFVQFRKNRAFHSGIGRSPYEAMFGCPVRLGVASVGFPLDETTNLNQEEDIGEIDNDINIRQEDDIENNLDGVQLTNNEHLNKTDILNERQLSAKCLENRAKKD
ncbi:KRAB-A domain-containing protein 2-like [Acyrthosiphon pisum]|uniref:Integrase catalytic domain-containing protein n=1 Tax=Acyrthosiphon pisum TaxID=7029 RepID=A0A8R2BAS6_ACYPI|nr:KRAB-A domain-containing protein 2-like [Acyrthosiphon pisum]|eukprot:XP_008189907.1 PREDICTED: KRAB-A domain-containing protein 2-like [Acyrthosiphon pisum]